MEKIKKSIPVLALVFFIVLGVGIGIARFAWAIPIIKKPVILPPTFEAVAEIERCRKVAVAVGNKEGDVFDLARKDQEKIQNIVQRLDRMLVSLKDMDYETDSFESGISVFHRFQVQYNQLSEETMQLIEDLDSGACNHTSAQRSEKIRKIRGNFHDMREIAQAIKISGWNYILEESEMLKNQR